MKKLQTIYAVMSQLHSEDESDIDSCYVDRDMAVEYIEKIIKKSAERWNIIYEYDGDNCWKEPYHKFWIEETTLE